jgi:hypothetical protein
LTANTLSFGILERKEKRDCMATTTRKKSSTGARSSTSRKKPSANKNFRGKTSDKKNISTLFSFLSKHSAGKFLLIILGILCIIGLNFLFTLNNFEHYFILLGIELILAILTTWIAFVIIDRKKNRN